MNLNLRGVAALIDCGALTAGATNNEIAQELLDVFKGTERLLFVEQTVPLILQFSAHLDSLSSFSRVLSFLLARRDVSWCDFL